MSNAGIVTASFDANLIHGSGICHAAFSLNPPRQLARSISHLSVDAGYHDPKALTQLEHHKVPETAGYDSLAQDVRRTKSEGPVKVVLLWHRPAPRRFTGGNVPIPRALKLAPLEPAFS